VPLRATGNRAPPVPDDYQTRRHARLTATLAVTAAIAVAGIVAFVPRLWDDQEPIRYVLTTLVVGLAAIPLALFVIARMGRDLGEQGALQEGLLPIRLRFLEKRLPISRAAETAASPPLDLNLTGVDLREAVLPDIDLKRADLTGALLEGADLRAATLRETRLLDADLRKTDLREAQLQGADMRGADLGGARVNGARHDRATRWPAGVDPDALGAIRIEGAPR
jgi:Pentapeptide repeats (8 copies)